MLVQLPGHGIAEVSEERGMRLLALGWAPVEPEKKPAAKRRPARKPSAKKSE